MRTVIALPFLFMLACFVFCIVSVIAVKAPRFFVSVCGGVVLLVLLYLSLSASPAQESNPPGLRAPTDPPPTDAPPWNGMDDAGPTTAPGATVGLSNRAPRTARRASSGTPPRERTEDAWSTIAPDWIGTVGARDGELVTRVIGGELYATPDEANNDALTKAAELAHDYLGQSLGHKVRGWNVPRAYVNDAMVEDAYLEPVERDYGTMYRAHLLMNLAPEHRRDLERLWRHQVVRTRLWSAGGALGLVILLLTTVAGYLKLDEATQGYYSGRLKLAALALLTGGATTLLAVVRSAVG